MFMSHWCSDIVSMNCSLSTVAKITSTFSVQSIFSFIMANVRQCSISLDHRAKNNVISSCSAVSKQIANCSLSDKENRIKTFQSSFIKKNFIVFTWMDVLYMGVQNTLDGSLRKTVPQRCLHYTSDLRKLLVRGDKLWSPFSKVLLTGRDLTTWENWSPLPFQSD